MFDILIPVGILLVISLVCAVLLTIASKFFAVKEDETAVAIRDCLPGANCGACGYSGCDGYAKALAEKSTDATNLCIPGGDGVAKNIAEILGVEAKDVVEKVAYVACNVLAVWYKRSITIKVKRPVMPPIWRIVEINSVFSPALAMVIVPLFALRMLSIL